MPEVGQALIRTFKDDDTDIHTVCRIIGKDPALTATLLRMANSALFGQSGKVDTLERAVNVVGMSQIRARALSVCLSRVATLPAGIDRMAESRAQCGADPQVNRHGRDRNPHPADFADGAVDRSVIDHQQVQVGETAPNRLEALQQRRDRRLLVVGGHDHEDAWARRRTALINQAGLHRSRLPPVLPQSRPHPVLRPRSTPPAQPGWSCRRLNRLTVPHRRLRG